MSHREEHWLISERKQKLQPWRCFPVRHPTDENKSEKIFDWAAQVVREMWGLDKILWGILIFEWNNFISFFLIFIFYLIEFFWKTSIWSELSFKLNIYLNFRKISPIILNKPFNHGYWYRVSEKFWTWYRISRTGTTDP